MVFNKIPLELKSRTVNDNLSKSLKQSHLKIKFDLEKKLSEDDMHIYDLINNL